MPWPRNQSFARLFLFLGQTKTHFKTLWMPPLILLYIFLLRDLRLFFTYSLKTCCSTMQIWPQQRFSLCVPDHPGFVLIFRRVHGLCVCVSCNTFRFQSNVPLREMVALHFGSVYLVHVFQITLITTPFKYPVKPGKHLPFLRAHTKPYHDERGLFGVQFPAWGFDGRKRQMKYLFSVDPRSRPLKLVDVWKTWWLKKR